MPDSSRRPGGLRPFLLSFLFVIPLLPVPVGPAHGQSIDTLALRAHTRFLAHDLLEGRGTATRGEALAALYLEARFRDLGLAPLTHAGYRLVVPLEAVRFDDAETTLRIVGGSAARTARPPDFYHRGGGEKAFRDIAGDLLYAGAVSGALEALRGYPDLTDRVVVLAPGWENVGEVEAELHRRGASGVIELVPNRPFYDRLRVVRGPVRFFLREEVDDPFNQGSIPVVVGSTDLIGSLGLGERFRPGHAPDRADDLGTSVRLDWALETEPRLGYNVAARLEGTDPALSDEPIVYVAHYDHVGYGEPAAGDSIWNGFVDNAAGVAMVLEVARSFSEDPPARPVVFLLVTGEEQGLLGSSWFVHDPPIALERIRAVINLDGGAPPATPTSWWISAAHLGALEERIRNVFDDLGQELDVRPANAHSDHWSFARRGVPTLFLVPGSEYENASDEEVQALQDRFVHPHTAADEWSPAFPFAGLRRYAEVALAIGRAVAE